MSYPMKYPWILLFNKRNFPDLVFRSHPATNHREDFPFYWFNVQTEFCIRWNLHFIYIQTFIHAHWEGFLKCNIKSEKSSTTFEKLKRSSSGANRHAISLSAEVLTFINYFRSLLSVLLFFFFIYIFFLILNYTFFHWYKCILN